MAGPATYFDSANTGGLDPVTRDLVERRDRALGPAYRLFYDEPLRLVRGLGTKVWDADGVEYLDAYNNVPSVGHAHPRVVAAITQQAETLNTHTRYLQPGIVDYAEQVLATLPPHIDTAMFACTGSEANDLALRIAKFATGGTGVIVTTNAYHGVTTEIAAISPSLGGIDSIADWVRLVDPDDLTNGTLSALASFADADIRPAALIIDTILASDGVYPELPGIVEAIAAVRAAGGLFIADEVQPGFGRLGTQLWGFERHGLDPDIVTVGKPMANGHPVSAVFARRELVDVFAANARYFNTFGGNTVSIAAAQATWDVLHDEHLMANAATTGGYLLSGLRELGLDARGAGLFIGVPIAGGRDRTIAVVNELRRRRVLLAASGVNNDVLKIRPPLPFTTDDADRLLTELDAALTTITV
jgi:4-aminobutyrate aminotransferase-like enzyme